MKLLFDFFPALLFFIAYKLFGIFVATGVLIAASTVQIVYMWVKKRRVEPMYLITFILILVFGGLTIALHDVMFLKWKVSIVNWLFGIAFIAGQIFMKKPVVQFLFEHASQSSKAENPFEKLPATVWSRLNLMWAIFFLALGTINVFVVYLFSTSVWVDFKVFGILGLTIIFMVIQSIYIIQKTRRHA